MSVNGTISSTISVGGVSMSSTITRSKSSVVSHNFSLPAGNASTDWARTDNDTGEATLASAHTITDGDVVCVSWSGGCRYGMVATVDGTSVVVEGGAGDNLPVDDTTVTVSTVQHLNTDFSGDEVYIAAASCDQNANIHFRTSEASGAGGSVLAKNLAQNEAWEWHSTDGTDPSADATNDLAGSLISQVDAANRSTTAATLKLAVLYDGVS